MKYLPACWSQSVCRRTQAGGQQTSEQQHRWTTDTIAGPAESALWHSGVLVLFRHTRQHLHFLTSPWGSTSLSVIAVFFGSFSQVTTGPIAAALAEKQSVSPASPSLCSTSVFLQATPSLCSSLIMMETQGRRAGRLTVAEGAKFSSSCFLLFFLSAVVLPPSPSSSILFPSVTLSPNFSTFRARSVAMAAEGLKMWTWSKENCR